MLVGHMRVSKANGSQSVELQRDALIVAGVDAAELYENRGSRRGDDRPGLAACLRAFRDGDTLVVWKLDRLSRNLYRVVTTVDDLTGRGVVLKVLTAQGAAIDTTTAAGKLVFGVFAARSLKHSTSCRAHRLLRRPRASVSSCSADPWGVPACLGARMRLTV